MKGILLCNHEVVHELKLNLLYFFLTNFQLWKENLFGGGDDIHA
jgi:hypothetical protein